MSFSQRFAWTVAAVMLAVSIVGSAADAQNFFCPTNFGTQNGIHFEVNECTNGNTGAYSNAALAAQALTDLSQSSTQDATKATMSAVANRRIIEQDRCPEGFTRIGNECRRNSSQVTPFAPEQSPWPTLPAQFMTLDSQALGYAPSRVRAPIAPPAAQGPLIGSWIQAYGDYEWRTGRARGPGDEFSVLTLDVKSTAVSGGVVGGVDVTLRNILSSGDGIIAGVLAGYLASTLNVDTTSTSDNPTLTPGGFSKLKAQLSGPSLGTYLSYFNGPFSTDFAFKADFLNLDISTDELLGFGANPGLGIVATMVPFSNRGTTHLVSYTTTGNVNYKIPVTSSVWLQPTAGIQYVKTDYDGSAAQFGLDDGYLLRLQGGMRIGQDSVWNGAPVTASFTGLLYDNVRVRGGLIQNGLIDANPLVLNDEGKLRAQGTVALNVRHDNGLSSFFLGEIRGGENLFGAAVKAGARLTW